MGLAGSPGLGASEHTPHGLHSPGKTGTGGTAAGPTVGRGEVSAAAGALPASKARGLAGGLLPKIPAPWKTLTQQKWLSFRAGQERGRSLPSHEAWWRVEEAGALSSPATAPQRNREPPQLMQLQSQNPSLQRLRLLLGPETQAFP